jgi:hypothetical protein
MTTSETQQPGNEIEVAFWNTLYEDYHPKGIARQHERLPEFATKLSSLNKTFDIVGLTEVEGNSSKNPRHNGEELARRLGYTAGFWQKHAAKQQDGYELGAFGASVTDAEFVYLGHGKKALLTTVRSIPSAITHFKFQLTGPERTRQAERLMDHVGHHDQGIIMLDRNALPWQRPNNVLRQYGYESVFKLKPRPERPRTVHIVPEYRELLPRWQRLAVGKGLWIDDILVKGLEVKDAGVIPGPSDHGLVYATLADPNHEIAA